MLLGRLAVLLARFLSDTSVQPSSMSDRFRGGSLFAAVGALAIPASQWAVFTLVARSAGVELAGTYALLLSISTAVFTFTNFGLRDSYITLRERHPFRYYAVARLAGVLVAWTITVPIGAVIGAPLWLISFLIIQKSFDSVTDLGFARLQRSSQLVSFGLVMLVNGLVTVILAGAVALLGAGAPLILASSAFGSGLATILLVVLILRGGAYLRPRGRVWLAGVSLRRTVRVLRLSTSIAGWQMISIVVLNAPVWAVAIVGSAESVGQFAALAYLLTAGSLAGSTLNAVLIGDLRRAYALEGRRAALMRIRKAGAFASGAGIVGVVMVVIFGSSFFETVYGPDFTFSPLELLLVGAAAALSTVSQVLAAGLMVMNYYTSQAVIAGLSLLALVAAAAACVFLRMPPVLVGGVAALAGNLAKLALSTIRLLNRPSTPESQENLI